MGYARVRRGRSTTSRSPRSHRRATCRARRRSPVHRPRPARSIADGCHPRAGDRCRLASGDLHRANGRRRRATRHGLHRRGNDRHVRSTSGITSGAKFTGLTQGTGYYVTDHGGSPGRLHVEPRRSPDPPPDDQLAAPTGVTLAYGTVAGSIKVTFTGRATPGRPGLHRERLHGCRHDRDLRGAEHNHIWRGYDRPHSGHELLRHRHCQRLHWLPRVAGVVHRRAPGCDDPAQCAIRRHAWLRLKRRFADRDIYRLE